MGIGIQMIGMRAKKGYVQAIYGVIERRKYLLILLGVIISVFTLMADISTGPARLSIFKVFATVFFPHKSEASVRVIVWVLRLPIALMAIVVGASLSVAGAEMQTILNNPLASPYTLGIAAGAGFGAALAVVMGVGVIPGGGTVLVPANAFFFSLLTCILIFSLSKLKGFSMESMVLTGIALLFLFHSMLALLEYLASEEELQAVMFWLFGSLMKTTWKKLGVATLILFITLPILLGDSWKLTVLRLGDEKAKSLGINVERLRLKTFVVISLLAASAVCFVGTIGFVGLVGPHIARMLVGEDQRFFLPMSAISGAFLLSVASIGSKVIVPGAVFPIGIITSFIGVPFFLLLVIFKRREFW